MIASIYKLYPQVITIRGDEAFDADGNLVAYDLDLVQAEIDSTAYIAKRVAEYPPIGDQMDALWKGGDQAAKMLNRIQEIKAKYPKG